MHIKRIDNHVRLMMALKLKYYVAIDCAPYIELKSPAIFQEPDEMEKVLRKHYQGDLRAFWNSLKVFPGVWVEELKGIHCAVVVCQRVYPDSRWEEVISSMTPKLVLQEDLHGCERQRLRNFGYVRTWAKVHEYGLRPFRPWPVFPWERNFILWRRRNFGDEEIETSTWRLFWRFCEWFFE